MSKEYKVIFGQLDHKFAPDKVIIKMTDCMVLPEELLEVVPQQMYKHNTNESFGFIVPALFDGEIIYK